MCIRDSDASVFVFATVRRKWYVYGDSGRKGYICLLSSGGHFDVLEGLCSHKKTPVPRQAEKQGLNRQTMAWHQVHVDVER